MARRVIVIGGGDGRAGTAVDARSGRPIGPGGELSEQEQAVVQTIASEGGRITAEGIEFQVNGETITLPSGSSLQDIQTAVGSARQEQAQEAAREGERPGAEREPPPKRPEIPIAFLDPFKEITRRIEEEGLTPEEAAEQVLTEREKIPGLVKPTAPVSTIAPTDVITPTVAPTVSPEFQRAISEQQRREQEQIEREQRAMDIFRSIPGLAGDTRVQEVSRFVLAAPTLFTIGLGGQVAAAGEKIGLAVGAAVFEPAAREAILDEVFSAAKKTPAELKRIVTSPEFLITLPLILLGARPRAPKVGKLSQVDAFVALNEVRAPPGVGLENIRGFEAASVSKTNFGAGKKAKTDFSGTKGTVIATEVGGELQLSGARLQAFDSAGKPIGTLKSFDLTKQIDPQASKGFGVSKIGEQPTEGFAFQTRRVIDINGGTLEFTSGELRTKAGEPGVPTRIITGTRGLPSTENISPFFQGLKTVRTTKLTPESATKLQGAIESTSQAITKQLPKPSKPITPLPVPSPIEEVLPTQEPAPSPFAGTGMFERTEAVVAGFVPMETPIVTPTPVLDIDVPAKPEIVQRATLIVDIQNLTSLASTTGLTMAQSTQLRKGQKELQELKEKDLMRVEQGTISLQDLRQRQELAFREAFKEVQKERQKEILEEVTVTTGITPTIAKPKIEREFRVPLKLRETLKEAIGLPTGVNVGAWDLLVKRRGKFDKVGTFSRAQALKLGSKITDTTLAATFRLIKSAKTVPQTSEPFTPSARVFRDFRISSGRKIPTPNQFIERKQFRLDSPREKRQIQRARSQSSLLGIKKAKKTKGRKRTNNDLLGLS